MRYTSTERWPHLSHDPIQEPRVANLALGMGQEERFFNKVEDDVSQIIQQERRREQYAINQGQEVNTSTEHEPVRQTITNTQTNQYKWRLQPQNKSNFERFMGVVLSVLA